MRVLTAGFLDAYPGRVLNTHPALSPAFPGVGAAAQALAHGVKVTGCTVHFVDAGVDTGPIIAQAAVPVHADDDADSLQRRIQVEEHRLLPAAVRALARGALRVDGRRVRELG
jgi:phosphoribosylglycinamide formyltransferase-1